MKHELELSRAHLATKAALSTHMHRLHVKWHEQSAMPKIASMQQRIEWHVAHLFLTVAAGTEAPNPSIERTWSLYRFR